MSNATLHCHPAHSHVGAPAAAIGIALFVGTFIAAIPQLLVLCRRRNSSGLSVLTPAINVGNGVFNFVMQI